MCKVLDRIILDKCSYVFDTSPYQFGFKKQHSTNICTFVVNEVIQYYMNNKSQVYVSLLDASRAFDRVEYVKLFELLLAKHICPTVCRFLINLYTKQLIRVKWGTHFSDPFAVKNGVKQGGVMSPLLFTVYMDELLNRLKLSHNGCHIGDRFFGAFGYADDIILLSPTLNGLKSLFSLCSNYATEYNVMFNSSKSKLIVYKNGCSENFEPNLYFMNGTISVVAHDKHLGNYIGNIHMSEIIQKITDDYLTRVNMVRAHFKRTPVHVIYKLFKTYCMPLYGIQLIDLTSPSVNVFYVAWRKSIRYLLGLPRNTHCALLPYICNDSDVVNQICVRFVKFLKSLELSHNVLVKTCHNIIKSGSCSAVSNSLSFIVNYLNCSRHDLLSIRHVNSRIRSNDEDKATKGSVIRDLLNMKRQSCYSDQFLTQDEISFIIEDLCTS